MAGITGKVNSKTQIEEVRKEVLDDENFTNVGEIVFTQSTKDFTNGTYNFEFSLKKDTEQTFSFIKSLRASFDAAHINTISVVYSRKHDGQISETQLLPFLRTVGDRVKFYSQVVSMYNELTMYKKVCEINDFQLNKSEHYPTGIFYENKDRFSAFFYFRNDKIKGRVSIEKVEKYITANRVLEMYLQLFSSEREWNEPKMCLHTSANWKEDLGYFIAKINIHEDGGYVKIKDDSILQDIVDDKSIEKIKNFHKGKIAANKLGIL